MIGRHVGSECPPPRSGLTLLLQAVSEVMAMPPLTCRDLFLEAVSKTPSQVTRLSHFVTRQAATFFLLLGPNSLLQHS